MTHRFSTALRHTVAAVAAVVLLTASGSQAHAQNAVKLIKGVITDTKTGKPINGGRVYAYTGSSTESAAYSKVNPRTGAYQFVLSPATDYRFEIVSPQYHTASFSVRTTEGKGYDETVRNFTVEPIPVGQIVFTGRPFDAGQSKLAGNHGLASVVEMLKKDRAVIVTVTVLADMAAAKKPAPAPKKPKKGAAAATPAAPQATGDPMAKLVEDRINTLKSYFKAQGINTGRLEWQPRTVAATGGKGKPADNVSIAITSFLSVGDSEGDD